MAFSLLTLFDDVASVLDDVALMTKVAAKKTSGVVGDDLALNAQQMTGIDPDQELPVVWAVAKGSMINKVILVPVALLISFFIPSLVVPLLMVGGAYLCFEGVEKIFEKIFPHHHAHVEPTVSTKEEKIKGAIRTDFILSAEIIVISLGAMGEASVVTRIIALSIISIAMTIGVYGLVGMIVKIDDFGLWLNKKSSKAIQAIGVGLIKTTPYLMKLLGIVGTIAMFLVGGGIVAHGVHAISDTIGSVTASIGWGNWVAIVGEGLVGIATGIVVLSVVSGIKKLKSIIKK